MKRCLCCLLAVILIMPAIVQAQTVEWNLGGVDETNSTWSEFQGQKVAIAVYINGVEVGRCWDNPALRECDVAFTLPKYYVVSGRLYFYAAPFPATPALGTPVSLSFPGKVEARKRVMDDGLTMAEMPKNSVRGKGLVSSGPAR